MIRLFALSIVLLIYINQAKADIAVERCDVSLVGASDFPNLPGISDFADIGAINSCSSSREPDSDHYLLSTIVKLDGRCAYKEQRVIFSSAEIPILAEPVFYFSVLEGDVCEDYYADLYTKLTGARELNEARDLYTHVYEAIHYALNSPERMDDIFNGLSLWERWTSDSYARLRKYLKSVDMNDLGNTFLIEYIRVTEKVESGGLELEVTLKTPSQVYIMDMIKKGSDIKVNRVFDASY